MKRPALIVAAAVAVGIGLFLSPFASRSPDGLETVADDHGFAESAAERSAPLAGYGVPGLGGGRLSRAVAGGAGTAAALGAALLVGRLLAAKRKNDAQEETGKR